MPIYGHSTTVTYIHKETEIPLTSGTDGLLGGLVQYYTMQQTLYILSLKLAQVKGQSLLVGNLVSTDISLF